MGMLLFVLLLGFVAFEAIGYGIHRVLHTPWAGSLSRAHMTHHLQIYPHEKFLTERYLPAAETGAASDVWRFAVPAVLLAALLLWLLPLGLAVPLVLELAAVGFLNAYAHDSLHVRDHWLKRFRTYRIWRRHHYLHHVDMGKNFGILTYNTDRVCGTYWDPFAGDSPFYRDQKH